MRVFGKRRQLLVTDVERAEHDEAVTGVGADERVDSVSSRRGKFEGFFLARLQNASVPEDIARLRDEI